MDTPYTEGRCKTCNGELDSDNKVYCSYCIPTESDGSPKQKKVRVKVSPLEKPKYVDLQCTGKCCLVHKIRTHDASIYTEELRKTWTCLLCTPYRKKGTKNEDRPTTDTSGTVPPNEGQ